ncbi:MAG: ABC transporter ATP-binding protein [Desulfovibrio sp.]|nr:MAG: ABC transporter ATP-binding protein [Desulfovibrio sp.]
MLLSLNKVSKIFGARLVFKNVSLDIDAGTVLLVAGPNGAGKSTLLKVMAGLARPTSGSVNLALDKAKLGFLGHTTFIYPDLSAVENLRFWAGLHGLPVSRDTLMEALRRMELAPFAGERAGTFSRGMSQRLSLARVFLLQPQLILLDEPGTGLDIKSMAILKREIEAAKERSASLVWVSHHLERDLALADQILYLENKQVAYFGPASGFTPPESVEAAP